MTIEEPLDVVVYMANRYSICSCISCGKKFIFMIKEFIPDESKNELELTCAVCGYKGNMSFDSVKENIMDDGYDIPNILEFATIQKLANKYEKSIHKKQEVQPK